MSLKESGKYKSLDFLKFEEVLNENPENPSITILAKDENDEKAVILLRKKPFQSNECQEMLSECDLDLDLKNDRYHTFDGTIAAKYQPLRYSMTYPASELHIAKARSAPTEIWIETKEMFERLHQPFISSQLHSLQWVYNILDKNREKCNEVDRIVVEDPDPKTGFLVVPDLKWDGKDTKQLNLCVLINRRDIPTVRHLNSDHLDLLENILDKSSKEIAAKYKIPEKQLRMYFHYPPSHYHLHVHITSTFFGQGCNTERAILLTDVIENIKMKSSFYAERTMSLPLRVGHKLHNIFENE
ncbi:unnamed protein product [Oikopleura dioica]|uniref:m7GpppX diphosphatase n=1 Tax=Oikopleura dioica TaxID=34765 RepID=E4WTN3_OIKDI|nr:unnamed protein product [Oikopleura dioica]